MRQHPAHGNHSTGHMSILEDYRHCWKGLHVYLKKQRQCPYCMRNEKIPTCKLPTHLKICRKGLHLYSIKDVGCKYCNRQRASEWYKNNTLRHLKNTKKWVKNNPEKRKKASRDWGKRNKDSANAVSARRRAIKRKAEPVWANKELIKNIYELAALKTKETNIEHHVDHIYPLVSDWMCGLHTEENLQILTKQENMNKSNISWPGQLELQKRSVYDIFSKDLTDLLND